MADTVKYVAFEIDKSGLERSEIERIKDTFRPLAFTLTELEAIELEYVAWLT